MVQCAEELDLPSYARVTFNHLHEPLDPRLRISIVLRVELPHAIRIDATWDWDSGGYWITAWQAQNGVIEELVVRWSDDKEVLFRAVETLSRQLT
jgi:hypothetical protein